MPKCHLGFCKGFSIYCEGEEEEAAGGRFSRGAWLARGSNKGVALVAVEPATVVGQRAQTWPERQHTCHRLRKTAGEDVKVSIRDVLNFAFEILPIHLLNSVVCHRWRFLISISHQTLLGCVELTGMSAFHAGGDEARNSSIADESSSSNTYIAVWYQPPYMSNNSQSFRIRL